MVEDGEERGKGEEASPQLSLPSRHSHELTHSRNPPGKEKPVPANLTGGAAEYFQKFTAMKKEILGTQHYWYLNLIARDPERREKGNPPNPNTCTPILFLFISGRLEGER